jgi:diacylglycerol kinase family enzyme
VFSCGAGLDATAARRVDAHPKLKTRVGPYYYTWAAVSGFYTQYLRNPIEMRVRAHGQEASGVTAVAQNSDPFTYFRGTAVRICEDVALDDGTLAIGVLRRAAQRDVPMIIARVLADRLRATGHRQIEEFAGVTEARVESISRDREGVIRPFPVQVDGDYIGDHGELELGIDPAALTVVA